MSTLISLPDFYILFPDRRGSGSWPATLEPSAHARFKLNSPPKPPIRSVNIPTFLIYIIRHRLAFLLTPVVGPRAAASRRQFLGLLIMPEQTINIPQLLAVLLVGFLAVRWYFSSSASDSENGSRRPDTGRIRQVDPARVEQVAQMFPQLSRRDIMWDLQRNGGSVQATTEKILGGRGLEVVSQSCFIPNSSNRRALQELRLGWHSMI